MSDTSDPLEILNAIDRERGGSFIGMIQANQVQRLRTEIVALRRTIMLGPDLPALAREQALEEAATACLRKARDYVIPIGQDNYSDGCVSCAAAIRALKDK